jgi:UDP-glucose 4-epimerase
VPDVALGAKPSRVLVTGGSGFVGSHVVDALRRDGFTPRILDLRPSPYCSPGDVETVVADIAEGDALAAAMKGCEAVVHLAAMADVADVAAGPVDAERHNARATLLVLEAARRSDVRRVVYASTVWVYSDVAVDEIDEATPVAHPAHLYTATKLAGELYCRAYQELYGVEYTVLRFGIPYGPRARPAAVIPRFVERALAGLPLTIAGDGVQSRPFVYVEDLADGVVRALAPVAANRTYNLSAQSEVTIAEVAEAVQEEVGQVGIERVPARDGDFQGAAISSERAAQELGWRPSTPLGEGLRRYVAWHRAAAAPVAKPVAPVPVRRRISVATALAGGLLAVWVLAALAGIAALDPLADRVGTPSALLWILLAVVPVALAELGPRAGRSACWGLASAELAVATLPWPGALGRAGHAHQVSLLLGALLAVGTADLVSRRGGLRAAPERS